MNPTIKGSLKSKIVWLGLVIAVAGYLQLNPQLFAGFVKPEHVGAITSGLGLLVIIARFFTSESLTDKGTSQ